LKWTTALNTTVVTAAVLPQETGHFSTAKRPKLFLPD